MALCQDFGQVKMSFSGFSQQATDENSVPTDITFHNHLAIDSHNDYEFVGYYKKLPDIQTLADMLADKFRI
jgi:hypothetical protein